MQDVLLAKVESANQAFQLSTLAGQSATVTQVSATTNLATITPTGQAPIIVKLDATRQVAEMKALLGKSVMIGKSPATVGAIGNWVSLYPVAQGQAAGAASAATSQLVMVKVQGTMAAAQLPALSGQVFTVAQPPMAAGTKAAAMLYLKPAAGGNLVALGIENGVNNISGLVGQSFTVLPSPVVGGPMGKFLVLKPVMAGSAAKVATAGAIAATASAPATGKAAAVGLLAGGGLMATGAGTISPLAAASAANAFLGTKGIALGLGLGLGAWGPVTLGLAGLVGASALYGYIRRRNGAGEEISDDALLAAVSAE